MTGKKIEIISQIVLWYENSFRILIFKLRSLKECRSYKYQHIMQTKSLSKKRITHYVVLYLPLAKVLHCHVWTECE